MAYYIRPSDPLLQYQFSIEVDLFDPLNAPQTSLISGYFTEISGMDFENEVTEYRAVGDNGRFHFALLPGAGTKGTITLKRGLTTNMGFWEWRDMVDKGQISKARTTVTITMYDRHYDKAAAWILTNAWPSKVAMPQMSADSSDIAVEELEIVYPDIKRDDSITLTERVDETQTTDSLGIPEDDFSFLGGFF